jgi:hypothetical protein
LAASACADKVQIQPLFPPATDIKAVTEPKPIAPVDIVTSENAAENYDIELESWGDRVSAAGGRICRWVVDNKGKLPFSCPPRPR